MVRFSSLSITKIIYQYSHYSNTQISLDYNKLQFKIPDKPKNAPKYDLEAF